MKFFKYLLMFCGCVYKYIIGRGKKNFKFFINNINFKDMFMVFEKSDIFYKLKY